MNLRLFRLAFLTVTFVGIIWGPSIGQARGAESSGGGPHAKPLNFLIFMADDQYKSSIGCYGSSPSHTPNIDRFATQGLRFTRCMTESAICTPNRAVFLSGMYPLRNGAHANHSGFYDGVRSLPNFMKDLGYRACLVNKDGIRKPSDLYEWEFRIKESDKLAPGGTIPNSMRHRRSRFDELEQFLTSDDRRPFCLLHASRQPHTPWLGKLPNGLEGYDASNWYMDYEFGRDLELLDKHGLTDSTVVIYLNDNETNQQRTKYTLYDTGINVPAIVKWPGVTEAESTSDAMFGFIDFLPTIVELAGGQPDPNWDGRSMASLWRGKVNRHRDEVYLSYSGVTVGSKFSRTPFPIRGLRTDRFKYLRNLNHSIGHPYQGGIKLPAEELYDLSKDPDERTNLIDDPRFASVRAELRNKVDAMMKHSDDQGVRSEIELVNRYRDLEKTEQPATNK